jgi:hypothetical protein
LIPGEAAARKHLSGYDQVVEVCEVADIRLTIPLMAFVKVICKSRSDRLRITRKKVTLGSVPMVNLSQCVEGRLNPSLQFT